MRLVLIASLAALLAAPALALAHDPDARAVYLGNEGVLVARGDAKILFDAFYADGHGQYALVPDEIANAMLKGEPPYDGVDAIFVSHVHGDHFSPAPALAYLRAHEDVALYASAQIREALLNAGVAEDDRVLARVKTFDLKPDSAPVSFSVGDLEISAAAVPHSGNLADIQNLVWRVTLDDKTTVMHLGDAGTVIEDFERHAGHFAERKTNMAFPPFWFLTNENGRTILQTYINADHVVGVHVPASAAGRGDETRAEIGGDVFTDPGESREIPDTSDE
jgi:L-ascorbate metabolism protein UlaG (beta-lactamase superfamily)